MRRMQIAPYIVIYARFGLAFQCTGAAAGAAVHAAEAEHSAQVVVAAHDGSSGLRNEVILAPSGSPPILPSGVS